MTNLEKAVKSKFRFEYCKEGILYYKNSDNLKLQIPVDELGSETIEYEEYGQNLINWIYRTLNIN